MNSVNVGPIVLPRRRFTPVLVLSVLAAALYAWGLSRGTPHVYYSSAIRSMSESWSNFFFGAFDPSGFVTTDKLPGSLWVHALFVRVFGTQSWVFLLPEVLAATVSVPLLFGAVRRWAGARAGFVAAVIFLCTPVVFVTAQVNIPDTLLMCSVVAAAYALVRALEHPGWRWLVLSAVLVGVGFQVKMLQALLVLPAFCLTYLFFADLAPRVRFARAVVYGALSVLVSLSWMIVVSLVPAGARPQVDGSASNSVWDMVFVHNGVSRGGAGHGTVFGGAPGPGRLFNEQVGTQIGWLLPLAALLLAAGVLTSLRGDRRDRAGWLLWGGMLLPGWAAFSALSGMHPYYTTVMAPALAAVGGVGLTRAYTAWQARGPAGWLLPAGVLLTAGWAVVLVGRQGNVFGWLPPLIVAAAVVSVLLLLLTRTSSGRSQAVPGLAVLTVLVAAVAMLAGPVTWMLSTPAFEKSSGRMVNPVAGPAPAGRSAMSAKAFAIDRPMLAHLLANRGGSRFLMAAQHPNTAGPYLADGHNVLLLRGFNADSPQLPVAELDRLAAAGEVRFVFTTIDQPGIGGTALEQANWVRTHCAVVEPAVFDPAGDRPPPRPNPWGNQALFDCRPPAP
ncbi:ArnT family glycosyltransferase [Amycolatopsis nigrescens]|uniref:ArnT family glycosyltransferase n=1 Tax=Amycolatopsis nigrescens TaxID=381445 RepID=UPI00036D1DA4|nr:glycosyltransferase family 39 protein [Amycolatopsis nigrescens]